jgi:hypothetical protein
MQQIEAARPQVGQRQRAPKPLEGAIAHAGV